MFKVKNKDTNVVIDGVFIVNFENISYVFHVFLFHVLFFDCDFSTKTAFLGIEKPFQHAWEIMQ